MRSSQLFSISNPPGMAVQMPAAAAAGTSSLTTSSGELYVNTSGQAALVPQASCNPLLPAAIGSSNDVSFAATQTNLLPFQQIPSCLASGYDYNSSQYAYGSTKAFYVAGVYYFFSPSDSSQSPNSLGYPNICWTSTTDLVHFTPAVFVTPCEAYSIVDVFYDSATTTWAFLDWFGNVISMTNIATFAGTVYSGLYGVIATGMTSNTFGKITRINGIWYVVGWNNAANGCQVLASTNLATWSVVFTTSTGTANGAISICQGAGTGAATEILIGCGSDTILKSVNNGASFTQVSTVTGLAGALIKSAFYSARTGLYYLGVSSTASANAVYLCVGSTGTLATATFTAAQYAVATGFTGHYTYGYITIVDTGTNVGVAMTNSANNHVFYYGASFYTAGTANITAAQLNQNNYANYPNGSYGAKSFWLNSTLVSVSGATGNGNSIPSILVSSTGATCSTGIAVGLFFPNQYTGATTSGGTTWSNLVYMGGAYYAASCIQSYYAANSEYYGSVSYLFELNAALTLLSCPVAPVVNYGPVNGATAAPSIWMGPGRLNAAGTSIVWTPQFPGVSNAGYVTLNVFNGTSFTSSYLAWMSPGSSGNTQGNTNQTVASQPLSCVSSARWSSLLSAWVIAYPAYCCDSSATPAAEICTFTAFAAGAAPTPLIAQTSPYATGQAVIQGWDVMSNGMVVALSAYSGTSLYNVPALTLNNGTANFALPAPSSSGPGYGAGNASSSAAGNGFAMWELVYAGVSYLVVLGIWNYVSVFNVWKCAVGQAPVQVVFNVPNATLNPASAATPQANINGLRRVFSYNGSFYLGDCAPSAPTTTRNSVMLTPSNGSFTFTVAHLSISGDTNATGLANTYTTTNSITTLNPVPIPIVFLPAGATGSFTKVK